MSKEESWISTIGELHTTIYNQDQKIADLEAKLADKDAEHELLINQFEEEAEKLRKQIKQESDARKRFVEEVKNLKQQLADKEKKIQDLMICEFVATTLDFNKLSADNCKLREQLAEHNQDKISFCIEQLEKVKEYIHGKYLDETWHNKIVDEDREDTHDFIDNQIKQLKEGR